MTSAIETRGLTHRVGRSFTLRDVDLTVPAGSIYGFLGPNGAGKTTTIRLLLGMSRPRAGTIRLLEHDVPRDLPLALQKIGYVPERPHLYPMLTVDEALRYHSAWYPKWDAAWVASLRERFALPGTRRVSRLSKGEAGRLMMLLALAQRPALLILDEPTDGLDPMVRRDVLAALLEYVSESGATVFISSHLVHELERFCDWIGVLDHGRMVAELPLHAFKNCLKRIRVHRAPPDPLQPPFILLSRSVDAPDPGETWLVGGWEDPMRQYFDACGVAVREIADLDLEDVFVELLRTSRIPVE